MPRRMRTFFRRAPALVMQQGGPKYYKNCVRRYYKYLRYYTPLANASNKLYKPLRNNLRLRPNEYWVIIALLLGYY